eukprot:TRINITY_DN406_c0_g1_i1.p1 TRINITY_DN406_c0_g1~~TRINITY_DN406_c0_g1_i1.p1  ORF type:complete len:177 (-),score=51.18 TRINITY_DN406_c0_g1_i1:86-616(-)
MCAKNLGCLALLLTLVCLPPGFIPAISGKSSAPKAPPLNSLVESPGVAAPEASSEQILPSYGMPLVCGLAMGLVLALPKAAWAKRGTEDPAVLLDILINKQEGGALGIDGLSWLMVYFGLAVASGGLVFVAAFLGIFLTPPRTMKDAPPPGQRKLPTPPIVDVSSITEMKRLRGGA